MNNNHREMLVDTSLDTHTPTECTPNRILRFKKKTFLGRNKMMPDYTSSDIDRIGNSVSAINK